MREFNFAFLDIPAILITLLIGHAIINWTDRKFPTLASRSLLTKLFYYHLFFAFVYCMYINAFGGDSAGYWRPPIRFIREGSSIFLLHQPGSAFIHLLTYPFSQVLGLSLWGGMPLFSLFGFGGFVCIYLTLRRTLKSNPTIFGYRVFPLILFLPNMHFWSAGVGKDTLIFFALALFIFSMTDFKRNIPGLVLSFYLAFFIRPHIAFVMLVGFGVALFVSSKGVSTFIRIAFISASILVFFLISDLVFSYIGLEDSIESYEDLANLRSRNLSRRSVGSAINITEYSVPLKIFTFLFRPLFFDAGNLFGLVVSIENLIYLILTIAAFRWSNVKRILNMPVYLKASLLITFASAFFLSGSLSNLGIIIRQKNMVMFMFVLVLLYLLSEARVVIRRNPARIVSASIGSSSTNIPKGKTKP